MGIDRSLRVTFEEVADLYDEARPGYPEPVFDDIVALSGISEGGRILEIWCGPGNATVPLARRGYRILAIELGQRMAALAADHCRSYPNVRVVNTTFEEWSLERDGFDLAVSASAFHWIPPAVSYPKMAAALRPGGSAALFWFVHDGPATDWSRAIAEVYRAVAPGLRNPYNSRTFEWMTGIITGNFAESGCFGEVTSRRHTWLETVSSDRYVNNLRTSSSLLQASGAAQRELCVGIRDIIDGFGGRIEVQRQVALFHARVKG